MCEELPPPTALQMECEANLRKAKQAYVVRCEDYDKAKAAASRAEEEAGGKTLEKKKRVEEDVRNKVLQQLLY